MDTFALSFKLTAGVGWAHAQVSAGPIVHETSVSYLTADPFGPLAQALIEFIWPEDKAIFLFGRSEEEIDLEALQERTFTWEDEPGGWRWTLRPQQGVGVKVRLERLSSRAGAAPLLDLVCSLRDVASGCVGCIEDLMLTHGIVGYRAKWHGTELPISQYLILKRWLNSPQQAAVSHDDVTWHDDLKLLCSLGV